MKQMSLINTMNNVVSTIHFIYLNCQGLGVKGKRESCVYNVQIMYLLKEKNACTVPEQID